MATIKLEIVTPEAVGLSPARLARIDDGEHIHAGVREIAHGAGRVVVGGEDDGAALRWFLKQSEFVIRGGSLRWIDEQRAAPPLELTDVSLVMRNGLRRHAMQLDATPPPGWGSIGL